MKQAHLRVLRVTFETREDFVREHAANLEKGGVFVETLDEPEPREIVRVEMRLEGVKHPVVLDGEVVHVVPQNLARAGAKPGCAVQFSCSSTALRAALEPFVSAAGSPTAAPPDDVGRRRAPRAPAQVPVRIEHNGNVLVGHSRNVSLVGMLASVRGDGVPPGEVVRATILHPSGEALEVSAVVIREVESEGGVVAIAIEFAPRGDEENGLRQFLADLQTAEHARRLGGIHGVIEEVGPQNLLQMVGTTSRAGTLTLHRGDEEAVIGFEGGVLRYARLGPAAGLKALTRILTWRDGSFEFHARLEPVEAPGDPLPLDAAIMKATTLIDEMKRLDLRALPMTARLRFVQMPHGPAAESTSKLEQAVLELSRANFNIRKALDVIPDPDPDVLRGIQFLAELGCISIDPV